MKYEYDSFFKCLIITVFGIMIGFVFECIFNTISINDTLWLCLETFVEYSIPMSVAYSLWSNIRRCLKNVKAYSRVAPKVRHTENSLLRPPWSNDPEV